EGPPAGPGQFRGGQVDISSEAMQFRHDSVIVLAPIPPGGTKQISYAYSLPAGTRALVIPIDQPTAEVNLLVEDTTAVVTAPNVESLGAKEIEQRDRKSTRLNSSHGSISYAVFCLKKKKNREQ